MSAKSLLMRMKSVGFGGITLAVMAGGCTIHPVPEDVTGVRTFDIVQQIRCETREAVIDSALAYLTKSHDVDAKSKEIGARIAEEYARDPNTIIKLNPKLFKGQVHDILNVFWTTGVAYNFNLNMTEANNADEVLNFGKIFPNGVFSLNMNGNFDLSRQNTRTFTITDNFGSLVNKPMDCSGKIVGPNYVYPIAGRIGVEDLVHTFVYLTLFANLAGESAPGTFPKGPPTLVDALLFTTTISGEVNPFVTFAPLGRTFSVAHASVDLNAKRVDQHQVVVGLAIDTAAQPQLGLLREEFLGQTAAPKKNELFLGLLTARGNRAELAAATAVNQYLTQKLFSPTINITP
jgi:hypothetical protein